MARSGVLGGRGEVKILPGSQRQKLPKLAVLFMSNNVATMQCPGRENNLYVCCPVCDPILIIKVSLKALRIHGFSQRNTVCNVFVYRELV